MKLPRDVKARTIGSVQKYFREKLDFEIGNLDAEFLLDFFVAEVGAIAYNHAIRDAQAFLQKQLIDLEAVCYEPEETYWQKDRGH